MDGSRERVEVGSTNPFVTMKNASNTRRVDWRGRLDLLDNDGSRWRSTMPWRSWGVGDRSATHVLKGF